MHKFITNATTIIAIGAAIAMILFGIIYVGTLLAVILIGAFLWWAFGGTIPVKFTFEDGTEEKLKFRWFTRK